MSRECRGSQPGLICPGPEDHVLSESQVPLVSLAPCVLIFLTPRRRAACLFFLFWPNCECSALHMGRLMGNQKCRGAVRQGSRYLGCSSQNTVSWSRKIPPTSRRGSLLTFLMDIDPDLVTVTFALWLRYLKVLSFIELEFAIQ